MRVAGPYIRMPSGMTDSHTVTSNQQISCVLEDNATYLQSLVIVMTKSKQMTAFRKVSYRCEQAHYGGPEA